MCGKSERDQMGLWHQDWEEYGESLQLALGGPESQIRSSEETEELTAYICATNARYSRCHDF